MGDILASWENGAFGAKVMTLQERALVLAEYPSFLSIHMVAHSHPAPGALTSSSVFYWHCHTCNTHT